MRLSDVYTTKGAESLLYLLLGEREPSESISHQRMPTWDEHIAFVRSRPYEAWFIASERVFMHEFGVEEKPVGAVYLTRQREVGVAILKEHRRRGYAKEAIRLLIDHYPGRMLANIGPLNLKSIRLFQSLGFEGPVQITLARP